MTRHPDDPRAPFGANELRVWYQPEWGSFGCWLVRRDDAGKVFYYDPSGEDDVWVERGLNVEAPRPLFRLEKEQVDSMFAMLWQQGVRNKEAVQSAEHRDAMTMHLHDMRELAAHALKVPLAGTRAGEPKVTITGAPAVNP